MTQFTPGTWRIIEDEFEGEQWLWIESGNQSICGFSDPETGVDETDRANARLIAAAPDLLETLREVEAYAINVRWSDSLLLDRIRAAIKQATGE